ncbi:hypothetical protein [Streptomyces enissocaesilis]
MAGQVFLLLLVFVVLLITAAVVSQVFQVRRESRQRAPSSRRTRVNRW